MSELLETMRGALRAHTGCAADRLAIINLFGAYAQDYNARKPGAFPDGGVAMSGEDES